MDALEGKVIAVTGASGIAAAAVANELSKPGTESFWAPVDLTDGDATEAAFAAGRARLGRLDGLFAVAGGSGRPLSDEPRMITGQVLAVDGGWSATEVG